jgi:hypothetical protein
MSIGNTTLRVAQWIVIGIAALNVLFSITNDKVGAIPNIVLSAVCYLLLIELLRLLHRAVRFWFETFRALDQNADNSVRHQAGNTRLDLRNDRGLFSGRGFNPTTGLPMGIVCDSGENFYGESEGH